LTVVVLIPARGGSKRIPKKNIKDFLGVPAICHTHNVITKALGSVRTVVSTDSGEIAEIALRAGLEVIERDANLADEMTGLLEVVISELDHILQLWQDTTVIACVLPTALLLSPDSLSIAVNQARREPLDFIVSIGRYKTPVQRSLRLNSSGKMEMTSPDLYLSRSQDLERRYFDVGHFYVGSVEAWRQRVTMFNPPFSPIMIEDWRAHDIDVEADWALAETLWSTLA
jgi:pseudaminic acid cytidylyltransferase